MEVEAEAELLFQVTQHKINTSLMNILNLPQKDLIPNSPMEELIDKKLMKC